MSTQPERVWRNTKTIYFLFKHNLIVNHENTPVKQEKKFNRAGEI
jgi:hypothetical protein